MASDVLTQDEIIDRLAVYLAQATAVDPGGRDCAGAGIVVGVSIAIALASGAAGPMNGEELARAGADVAATAYDRLSAPDG